MPKDSLDRLKTLTKEADEDLLEELLLEAREAILGARYPYGDWPEEIEPQYRGLQVQIAEALYDKIGGKYETGHTENGVTRQWASEAIPKELLARITPICRIGGRT